MQNILINYKIKNNNKIHGLERLKDSATVNIFDFRLIGGKLGYNTHSANIIKMQYEEYESADKIIFEKCRDQLNDFITFVIAEEFVSFEKKVCDTPLFKDDDVASAYSDYRRVIGKDTINMYLKSPPVFNAPIACIFINSSFLLKQLNNGVDFSIENVFKNNLSKHIPEFLCTVN